MDIELACKGKKRGGWSERGKKNISKQGRGRRGRMTNGSIATVQEASRRELLRISVSS